MTDPFSLRLAPTLRRFVVWCLLVAIPAFGFSGTLVELLGPNHVHRALAGSAVWAGSVSLSADADPMQGWVDARRGPGLTTTSHRLGHLHPHDHSHGLFARHHHDREDASVVALDGGVLQGGEAADDGGGGFSASVGLGLTPAGPQAFAPPSGIRVAWRDACPAPVRHWAGDGPLRPPRA